MVSIFSVIKGQQRFAHVVHTILLTVTLLLAGLLAQTANAGVTLTSPDANSTVVNGVTFSANVTSDIVKVDIYAGTFALGTLNSANNFSLRYTFSTLGQRSLEARGYNSANTLVSTVPLTITIVDMIVVTPQSSAEFLNGTPVVVAASDRVTQVVLKAETFEIGRSSTRDGVGRFIINPAIMGTIGARTFNFDALLSTNASVATKAVPVTVTNVTLVSPAENASFNSGATFTMQAKAVATATRVEYFADAVLLGSYTDAATMFSRATSLNTAGTRVMKATSYNSSNVALGSDTSTITIVAPTPTCTPPQVLQNNVCVTPTTSCQFGAWTSYNGVSMRKHSSGAYIYKTSNKQIDADGAPNAYHPSDVGKTCSTSGGLLGLDCPANAGWPNGSFWRDVLVVDPANSNRPYTQPSGPYAGFFISQTSLVDPAKAVTDPTRYVSSIAFPYIVFPGNFNALSGTGKRGDLGFAINLSNTAKKTHFVVAETGPAAANLGEMSINLATLLGGTNPSPINGSGAPSGTVLYVTFPFSSNTYAWPMTNAQMQANTNTLLQSVGGEAGILACQNSL
jgi:Fungal chitosanase of glycosyl hydrolase group 75